MIISIEDKEKTLNAINLGNKEYSKALMSVAEKYQLFSIDDILLLTDQKKSKSEFQSDYAMLRLIDHPENKAKLVKDKAGHKRYYSDGYSFYGNVYVFTSQLYGYGGKGTHKDNRTPFYQWFLKKIENEDNRLSDRYPVGDENGFNDGRMADPIQYDLTDKEVIESIKNYIKHKGFSYSEDLIENFYLSLKSKPFTILAGTSGTGKTRLVKLFAEAIGVNTVNGRYKMVPVRPDWSDSSDLFGHVDLNGKFVPGEILEFIANAQSDSDKPYILCLDEMNLARVEYYLSDFLSVIETREVQDGKIVSDPLVTLEKYGADTAAKSKYGEIRFPQNLYLVGTVNMDETTFPFSKKVLDRANTIEFDYVDLNSIQITDGAKTNSITAPNSFLETKYLFLKQCMDEDAQFVKDVCDELQKINVVLQKANAHVGYRVRDEIVFYLMNNKKAGLLSDKEALDNEIMQKILPRIQGSSVSVKEMLCELFKILAGDFEGYQTKSNDVAAKMKDKLNEKDAKIDYPKSARKVAFMVRRFEEDGFTSYWL